MNVLGFLRRLYLILLSLIFIVVLAIFLLSPATIANWAGSISEISVIVRGLLAALLVVALLVLMYVQVRRDPRSNVTGLVMRGSGAVTEVSVESARERILNAVSDVPDVVSAEAEVKPVEGRADVELQVVVMGYDVKLPVKQKEINRALKQVIDKQLGLRYGWAASYTYSPAWRGSCHNRRYIAPISSRKSGGCNITASFYATGQTGGWTTGWLAAGQKRRL